MDDKKKSKDIPQLWTAISHEIRTPLNVIKGMTDISENELYDTELMKDCLAKIKKSTDSMQQIVNSLVDYAAISQNNIEIQKNKLDFKMLITEIAMHSYLMAKDKNCHFNMHIKEVTEETLCGDEARISQVIVALLNLVIRYTASEGMIDFTVRQTGISKSSVFMRFSLRSTALQFPNEIVKYINDQSLYMNAEILAPIGPLGLVEMNALYISLLMGGKIKAHNCEGDYSEIVFDNEFERIEQPDFSSGAKMFSKQRILIIAETEEICHERGRMLADMGMQYDIATEKDAALEKIGEAENGEKPFTICIIDWDMHDQQSSEIILDIRQIFGTKLTILAASHDPEKQQKQASYLGINFVINRTIFRSTLFDALVSVEKGIEIKQHEGEKNKYDFSGKRILVAEDVALNMEVITKLLSRVNVDVVCVEDGREAVMQFERKPEGYFDAILLDINMPVMDGYEAAKTIRKSGKKDAVTIPIYAMTANAFKEDVEDALNSGMDGHIAKPIDVNALYGILHQALFRKEDLKKDGLQQKSGALERENMQLRNWAEHDPLTGCLNRRGFEMRMKELVEDEIPIAYMAIDLDDFKQVNDRFGHDIGDQVLVKVVKHFKKKFRASDYYVRMGGDEFVVVLVGFKRQKNFLIQRISEINDELLHPTDNLPPITVSVGAAISSGANVASSFSMADKALYHAKNSGKGKCSVYEENVDTNVIEVGDINMSHAEDNLYFDDHVKVLVDKKSVISTMMMSKNNAIGFVTGFSEKNMPVYSLSGFLLDNLGYKLNEFRIAAANGFLDFIYPDDREYFLNTKFENNKMYSVKLRIRHKTGDYLWFHSECYFTETMDKRPFWMASIRKITDDYIGTLCSEDFRMVALINVKNDSIVIEKGAHLLTDKELYLQKKYSYNSLHELAIVETVKSEEQESYIEKASLDNIIKKVKNSGVYEFTLYHKLYDSEICAVRHKFRYLPEREDSIILYTWEIMKQWTEIDEITDVLNETGFYREAEAILGSNEKQTSFSILYFNISGFKAWNSMLGKECADRLLKSIAREIKKSKLAPLAISRLFSDNFVCLIKRENCNTDVINRLCNMHIEIEGNQIVVRMRCGIFDVSHTGESIRSMCDKAKLAKMQVENEHAIPYHAFNDSLDTAYIQQIQVLNNVSHALERKEIKVFYQPIVNAKTRKIESAEALIRWMQPGNHILSPAIFIPALEEQGLISEVDTYAQQTVSELIGRRCFRHKNVVPVSVNVSRRDFLNADFFEKLKTLISTNRETAQYMNVEITESAYIEVGQNGREVLKYLRDHKVNIMMDDFGTGFSSLIGLTSKDFNIIKIDMSLIHGIGKENGAEAVVQGVITMCHTLHMCVVAEGVETEEQYQFLLNAGCDYIQGYYFYKPMPEDEFEALLDRENSLQN